MNAEICRCHSDSKGFPPSAKIDFYFIPSGFGSLRSCVDHNVAAVLWPISMYVCDDSALIILTRSGRARSKLFSLTLQGG